MSANGCVLTSDVFAVCLTHALSTEREEVMGLLIGDVCRTGPKAYLISATNSLTFLKMS